jgi:hypothetical protein
MVSQVNPFHRPRLCQLLTVASRVLLSAWVGGAVLFVITSVAEQSHPGFDSFIRDQLATIRFPLYYQFCWFTLGTSLLCTAAALLLQARPRNSRLTLSAILSCIALLIAVIDYQWIYKPLQSLISPPGQTRTPAFTTLHEQSKLANETHLAIALISALILCSCPTTHTAQRPAENP